MRIRQKKIETGVFFKCIKNANTYAQLCTNNKQEQLDESDKPAEAAPIRQSVQVPRKSKVCNLIIGKF